jgi:peptidoglycan/xylan/chitin deacetylase (PgdA/CDA1 family)
MYHSVSQCTDDPYRITVSPHRLDRQLGWLHAHGLTGVSVARLRAAQHEGRATGLVGLTFDDGYADFLDTAMPLLRRYRFTATVFVLPGRLGGQNAWDPLGPRKPLLTQDGIRAVAEEGMEIGSHGLFHTSLVQTDDEQLRRETADSRRLIEMITGAAPDGFCYPYGHVDARAVEAVRAAGYGYACAIAPGRLDGPHALPRTYIGPQDTALRLRAKLVLHRWRSTKVAAR